MSRFPVPPLIAQHLPRPASCWLPAVALSMMTLLIQGTTLMSLGVFLPSMAADFDGQAGGAAAAFLLAMGITNLPVGWALDRIGTRPVLLIGIVLSASGFALASLAQDIFWLAAAMAVTGVGVSASTIVPGIAIITHLHVSRRGLALALFLGAAVIAGAAVPPIVGATIQYRDWHAAMLLGALIMALACPPLLFLIPGGKIGTEPNDAASPWAALCSAHFCRFVMATTLLQLAINGVLFAAVGALMTQGLTQPEAVAAYSVANLLGLPALLLGGMVADRLGARPSLIATALLLALGTAALISVRAMALPGVALFILLWGVASALPGQSGSMLLADIVPPDAFPRALGCNTAIISLAGALAPILTDQMRQASGGYTAPMLAYAALALAAAPLIALLRPSEVKTG